jgi:hypothetical protein
MDPLEFMTPDSELDFAALIEEVKEIDREIHKNREEQKILFAKVMKRRATIKKILMKYCTDGNGEHRWRPFGPYDSYCADCGANR